MFTITSEPKFLTLFRGAIITIAAIVMFVLGGINCYRMSTPAIDLNDPDLDWDTLKAGPTRMKIAPTIRKTLPIFALLAM